MLPPRTRIADASSPVTIAELRAEEEAPLNTDAIDVNWDGMRPAVEIMLACETAETVRPPGGAALGAVKDGPTSAAGPITDIDQTRKIPAFSLALALARVTADDD